jgi:hypothetical protein
MWEGGRRQGGQRQGRRCYAGEGGWGRSRRVMDVGRVKGWRQQRRCCAGEEGSWEVAVMGRWQRGAQPRQPRSSRLPAGRGLLLVVWVHALVEAHSSHTSAR